MTPGHAATKRRPPRAWLLAAVLACAGCASQLIVMEGNYLTFEHPFTEAGAASVRAQAEEKCRDRKEVAVRTGGTCSLTQCTTHYQCMSAADAARYK